MGFAIVVKDLGLVFAGNIQLIREIVITGGEDDFASAIVVDRAVAVRGGDPKVAIFSVDSFHPLILSYLEVKVLGDAAIVFQGFEPGGLGQRSRERHIADLEATWRGEKHHVGGVAIDGIDEASFIDDERPKPGVLGLNRASHTGGTCANHQDIG